MHSREVNKGDNENFQYVAHSFHGKNTCSHCFITYGEKEGCKVPTFCVGSDAIECAFFHILNYYVS